jgi:DNA primase
VREHVLALVQRHMQGPFRASGGGNVLARCPFHKGGEERKPSFSVNLESGLWHCFTCHIGPTDRHGVMRDGGNLRQLLEMLRVPQTTIEASLKIIEPDLEQQRHLYQVEQRNFFSDRDPFKADSVLPEAILGVYRFLPTKLVNDGFSAELLQDMEIGYDRRLNRIMFPLRDMYGNLAGFSGGVTPLTQQQHPKYHVYQGRRFDQLNGRWIPGDFGEWFDKQFPDYVCQNHDFLWNFDRVYPNILPMSDRDATVFVVEGFKACLWMIMAGFVNTVGLMGSYISDRQQKMLHRLGCNVVLFLDNDKAGMNATFNVGNLLWGPMYGRVQVVPYPEGDFDTQPDDYELDAVQTLVSRRKTFLEYMNSTRRGARW